MAQTTVEQNTLVVKAKSVHITSADYVGQVEIAYISTENKSTVYVATEEGGIFDEVRLVIVDRDIYITIKEQSNTIIERWFNVVNYWLRLQKG